MDCKTHVGGGRLSKSGSTVVCTSASHCQEENLKDLHGVAANVPPAALGRSIRMWPPNRPFMRGDEAGRWIKTRSEAERRLAPGGRRLPRPGATSKQRKLPTAWGRYRRGSGSTV